MAILHIKTKPISLNNAYPTNRAINKRVLSQEAKAYKNLIAWEAKNLWGSQIEEYPNQPWIVIINLRFKDKVRRDIDNYAKLILDSLTGIIWEDDSQVVELKITKEIWDEEGIDISLVRTST